MWILPRQLHTSAYVPDTEALNWDSTELSEICARSLFVRSKPSPARTWSQKWKRDSWTAHLSGRILRPSHGQTFVAAWTSSLGVIPASPSAQPESASAQKTLGTSGHLSQTEFGFSDLDSASLRMSKVTSPSDSERSLESWNKLVIQRRGKYSARLKSAHRTSASGCLSWRSPIAQELGAGPHMDAADLKLGQRVYNKNGKLMAIDLNRQVDILNRQDAANWPTPRTNDDAAGRPNDGTARVGPNGQRYGINLSDKVLHGQAAPENPSTDGSRQGLWATPNTMDCLPPKSPEALARNLQKGGCRNLREDVVYRTGQWGKPTARDHKELTPMVERTQAGKLNPRWVETLMGLPVGWVMPSCASPVTIAPTNCGSSETESCQPQQSELFEF